jgi:hypothetical protein
VGIIRRCGARSTYQRYTHFARPVICCQLSPTKMRDGFFSPWHEIIGAPGRPHCNFGKILITISTVVSCPHLFWVIAAGRLSAAQRRCGFPISDTFRDHEPRRRVSDFALCSFEASPNVQHSPYRRFNCLRFYL